MKHPVDIDNWNRRENYLFFRDFANPYYSGYIAGRCNGSVYSGESAGYQVFALCDVRFATGCQFH